MSANKKSKNPLGQGWLILYNIAMTAGWLFIGILMVNHYLKHHSHKGLYRQVEKHLLIFQSLAVLEIIHAMVGLVKSNPLFAFLQVFSRVGILWGVIQPVTEAQTNIGFTMLLVAWTITEIIRYLFYTFVLLGITPRILLWMRYTLFIVLYPIGVSGETLTIYNSLASVRESGLYSIRLPNPANFALDYHTALLCTFPVYIIFFPQLYFHMFAQRKKQLQASTVESSQKKMK